MTKFENLNNLYGQVHEFANIVFDVRELKQRVKSIDWWININPDQTYNVAHSHPKADLSIVYYAKVDTNAGDLVLMRNDGAMHLELFSKVPQQLRLTISPVVGRLYAFPAHLLHYVQCNESKGDRVSLAFNVKV